MTLINNQSNPLPIDIEALRAELMARIEQIEDVRVLRVLLATSEAYEKEFGDSIVGYEADGTAVRASVSRRQFAEDLAKPEEFMSVEDFEKELDQIAAA